MSWVRTRRRAHHHGEDARALGRLRSARARLRIAAASVLGLLGWLVVVLALAGTLGGCASMMPFGKRHAIDGEKEAAAIVWSAYGMPGRAPVVYWVRWERLGERRCVGTHGGRGYVSIYTGECVAGETAASITVLIEEGQLFSDTAMAHELRHRAGLMRGDPWPHHPEGSWARECREGEKPLCLGRAPFCEVRSCVPPAEGKAFYADVDRANAALRAAGK